MKLFKPVQYYLIIIMLFIGCVNWQLTVYAESLMEEVHALFASPSRDYSTGPLWVWNDDLSEDDIRLTLREMAGQSIKQVWVHPRPGMKTIYLSDDWFKLWEVALDEAEKLDMNVWIYDENSYPSGFAGGHVPAQMPESRLQGLVLTGMQGTNHLEVFYNGDLVGDTRESSGIMSNTDRPLRIGQRADGDTQMKGHIGEVWIYEYALSDAQLDAAVSTLAKRFDIKLDNDTSGHLESFVEADFSLSAFLSEAGDLPEDIIADHATQTGQPVWYFGENAVLSLPVDSAPKLTESSTGLVVTRFDDFANFRGILGQTAGNQPAPIDWYVNQNGNMILYRGDGQSSNTSVYSTTALPADEWVILAYRIDLDKHDIPLPANYIALYEIAEDKVKRITEDEVYALGAESQLLVAQLQQAGRSPWYGGWYYVDLMMPGVTEKFLEVTMEPYRERFGKHFGERIPGVFTDEPNIQAPGLSWTGDLPDLFEARWGYDLLDHIPSLSHQVGDWRRVRHNYYQVLLDTFIERWAMPFYNYCEEHNLEFTGHYWEHGWPDISHGPDTMAMSAWQQRPGIDQLFYHYNESIGSQFGNVRMVRELNSVANQLGRERTLCESYGASGWEFRFEDMKRVGDWLHVLGVNTLNQHLSYISIRGARKRDHPPSFSYHAPWFKHYQISADYFARLSVALTQGVQKKQVLVLQPTTTAWMYQRTGELGPLGAAFHNLIYALEMDQIAYDIGSEYIMEGHGSVRDGTLVVGKQSYTHVVLPDYTENLNYAVYALLKEFLESGGKVLSVGLPPNRVDGKETTDAIALATMPGWSQADITSVASTLQTLEDATGFKIQRDQDDQGILFHMRRHIDDGELVFLVNTSIDNPSTGTFYTSLGGVECWDAHTGSISPYSEVKTHGDALAVDFTLPPSGSLLLHLTHESLALPDQNDMPENEKIITANSDLVIERLAPNTLTLDYADVTAAGETRRNQYVLDVQQWLYQVHDMPGNPWNVSVQFDDSILRKEFPADSGFVAEYVFDIENELPKSLSAVVEGPEYYRFTINDQPVQWDGDSWWLDRRFGKIDIAEHLQAGENRFALHAQPFVVHHELEAVYLVGDFSLVTSDRGWQIGAEKALTTGSWREQGMPFYADAIAYRQTIEVPDIPSAQMLLSMADWNGAVAEVHVNGVQAGHIAYPPWTCDITDALQPGANEIEVRVYGTLRNLLGPHHNRGLGLTGPGSFGGAPADGPPPGEQYFTLDYGLYKPFEIVARYSE